MTIYNFGRWCPPNYKHKLYDPSNALRSQSERRARLSPVITQEGVIIAMWVGELELSVCGARTYELTYGHILFSPMS